MQGCRVEPTRLGSFSLSSCKLFVGRSFLGGRVDSMSFGLCTVGRSILTALEAQVPEGTRLALEVA